MRARLKGFTLIELMITLAIISLLLSIVTPRYFNSVDKAREATLRENLHITRDAIDKFFADKGKYPENLQELVEQDYLRGLPIDPITDRSDTWLIVPPKAGRQGKVFNLHSTAPGQTINGKPYAGL